MRAAVFQGISTANSRSCIPLSSDSSACSLLLFSRSSSSVHPCRFTNIEPEAVQSGCGLNFIILAWRILVELPANFDGDFFLRIIPPCFSGISGRPKKFTPKVHAQNCRHSSSISLSRTQYSVTPIFCLRGRPTNSPCRIQCQHQRSLALKSWQVFGVAFAVGIISCSWDCAS